MAKYKLLAEDTSTGQLKKSEAVSLNVKDFGAYSDGTNATITTTAINNAISACLSATGQEVYLPSGTYLVNDLLVVPGGVTLRGDGQEKTIIYSLENSNIINAVEGTGAYATLGPKIYDLQVKGDKAAGFQIGIYLEDDVYLANAIIENVTIKNCGSHGLFIGKAFSSRFVNIYSTDNTGYPFVIDSPSMPSNHYESLYAQDLNSTGNCGFRIKRGTVKLISCNGVNNNPTGSLWAIVGNKNGVDGAVANASAYLELSNCNLESTKAGGIKCYYNSVVNFEGQNSFVPDGSSSGIYKCLEYEVDSSLFPPYFTKGRINDNVVFASSEYSAISGTVSTNGTTTLTGTGTSFTTSLVVGQLILVNGQTRKISAIASNTSLTVSVAFTGTASGLTLNKYFYAENELIHANDLPPIMSSGQGVKIAGGTYRNSYYNTVNSRSELIYRSDAFLARQTVTTTASFTNPGARYFEVNPSSALTLTLPWPGWYSTQELLIIKDVSNNASTNNITINVSSGGTINGVSSYVLNKNGQCLILVPNEAATDYRIILNYQTSPDVVNVKEFGAKGDGSTNDSTSIANALTFAATQKKPVYIPSGTYIVNSVELGSTDGLYLYGDGVEKTIIKSTQNGSIVKVTTGTANRLQLKNFTVEGNSTGSSQVGLQLGCNTGTNAQYSNVQIENIHIKNTGGSGFQLDKNSAFTASFKNITVRNAGGHGIDCDTGGPNLLFENCYVFSVGSGKAAYRFRRGKPVVSNCNGIDPGQTNVSWVIVGSNTGLGDSEETYAFPTFIGCNFEDYTGYGADCYVGSTCNLIGCSFDTVATNTKNDLNFRGSTSSTGYMDGTTSFISPATSMQGGKNIRSFGRLPLNLLANKIGGYDNSTGVNASYSVTAYYNYETSTIENIPCLENVLTRKQITSTYTQYERGLSLIDCRHSTPITVSLIRPDSAVDGTVVEVKDGSGAAATNNITVQSAISGNIDGASTYVINQNYQSVKFYCDGTNWFTLGKLISSGSGTTINSTNSIVPYRSSSTAFSDSNIIRASSTVTELRDIATGTNAQILKIYGTSDNGVSSPTNYVRGTLTGSSTGLTIGVESGGTGSANQNINLSPTGTGFVQIAGGTIRGNGSDIKLEDSSANRFFRAVRATAWGDAVSSSFFQVGNNTDNIVFTSNNGSVANRVLFTTDRFNLTDNDYTTAPAPGTTLLQINTRAASSLKPLSVTVNGTSNGIEVTTSGLLQKVGTGGIDASSLSSGTVPLAQLSGITTTQLSGTAGITNAQLANNSVTIGSTSVSLGATAATVAGLTLTTPTIGSFANSNHNHTNSAGGGQLTISAFSSSTGSGSIVGATSPTLTNVNLNQAANNADAITSVRFTDSTPTGNFVRLRNAANNADLFTISIAGTVTSGTWNGSVIGSSYGGAGTVNGLLKANGSGTVSAAVSGTDYAPATSGSSILYGNASGGFSSVTVGTGLSFSGGSLTLNQAVTPTWTGLHTFNTGTTPSNVVLLDINTIGSAGTRDSHNLIFRGRSNDGTDHLSEWRLFNDVTSNAGASTFLLQSRVDANSFADRMTVTDGGTVTATLFSGSGASLTNLNGSNITSGTIPAARMQEVLAVTDLTTYAAASGTGTDAIRSTITSPLANDILSWDGTNWINTFNSPKWSDIASAIADFTPNNAQWNTTISQSTGIWSIAWSGNTTTNSLFKLSSTNTSATGYILDIIANSTGSNLKPLRVQARQSTVIDTDAAGNLTLSPRTVTSGTATGLTLTGAAHSGYTAGTEITDINFNLARTVNRSAGAVSIDRAVRLQGRTLSFASASTVTDAINLDIETITAGTSATITRSTGLRVKPSVAAHHGLWVDGTAAYTGDAAAFGFAGSKIVRFVGSGATGSMNSVFNDNGALSASATDGFIYVPRIDNSSNPSGTPTSFNGSSAFVLKSDTTNARYQVWSYMNSSWRKVGDSAKEEKIWLPAAGANNATAGSMWDLPTTGAATPAVVTGTNIQKGVLNFVDASTNSAQITLYLPSDFTGNIDANIIWTTSATSGNCKWTLSTAFTSADATATDDPSFSNTSTVTTAAPGVANRVQTSSITNVTSTGSGANKLMHLKISRDPADAADTISATASLIGVEITIRRTI